MVIDFNIMYNDNRFPNSRLRIISDTSPNSATLLILTPINLNNVLVLV